MQDLLRFGLALSVVIFHFKHFAIMSALSLPRPDYEPPFNEYLSIVYQSGYHAVAVFFFLSGFMLTNQNLNSHTARFDYRTFITKRIARIYPAHVVTLFIMVVLAVAVEISNLNPFITYNDDFTNFLISTLLLNGLGLTRDTSFNLPSWSLSVEALCYLLLAVILIFKAKFRNITPARVFLSGLLIGAIITEVSENPNLDNVGSGLTYFFAGALTSVSLKRYLEKHLTNPGLGIVFPLVTAILSIYASWQLNLGLQKVIWIFISLPMLVCGIEKIDQLVETRVRRRPFLWFGLISFSVYIWHFPVQSMMHHGMVALNPDLGTWYNSAIFFACYIALTLLAAQFSLKIIEPLGSSFVFRIRALLTRNE